MKKLLLLPLLAMIFACGSKENENAIKGLVPYDVTKNFENQGFTFEKTRTEIGTSNKGVKNENGINYTVSCFGSDYKSVESVNADIFIQGDKNIIAGEQFLIFTASLPYESSKPEVAAKWIQRNYNNDKKDTIIGDVKFTVLAPSKVVRRLLLEKVRE